MIRYAITDRSRWPGEELARLLAVADQAAHLARLGVEFLQLREKDMDEPEFEEMGRAVIRAVRIGTEDAQAPAVRSGLRVLVNSRLQVAVRIAADGVHLPGAAMRSAMGSRIAEARETFRGAGLGASYVSVSCHTLSEVREASRGGADAILFGPVYGKQVAEREVVQATGVERLRESCEAAGRVPVLALGGVTAENFAACLEAGAAGVAGIRLFL